MNKKSKNKNIVFKIISLLIVFVLLLSLTAMSNTVEAEGQDGVMPELVTVEEGSEEKEVEVEPQEDDDNEETQDPVKTKDDFGDEQEEEKAESEETKEKEIEKEIEVEVQEDEDNEKHQDSGINEEVSADEPTEEEIVEIAENYPDMLGEPALMFPDINFRTMGTRSAISDTIEVDKTAVRSPGCRTFEVTLDITGEPQEAPVDVVLVIDRSGSMKVGNTIEYVAITTAPINYKSYYVKIGGSYQSVSYSSGGYYSPPQGWYYGSGSNRRYVNWDANGDDSSPGGNSNNPVGKPYYESFGRSRMYLAKQAALNFAAKVLGPNGVPGSRVSIVSYAGPTTTSGSGGIGVEGHARTDQDLTSNISLVNTAINALVADGGTNTEAGFLEAKKVITDSDRPNSNKVVIMFTDGMPTSSIGNAYGPNDPTSDNNHTIAAYTAGQDIYNNGIADVFTVGLFEGMTGSVYNLAVNTLTAAQNKGFYDAPTAAALDGIFEDISTQLGYAATQAKVVDKIGDNFDLVESSLPAGATYNSTTREISWNPGTIYTSAQLKYVIQAQPYFAGVEAFTNEYANLTYKDIFGTAGQTKNFPVPEVDVPSIIKVSLTDATITSGESISLGTGTSTLGENYMSPVIGGDNDGESFTYEWRKVGESNVIPGGKNPSVSPTEDTEYEVTVTDSNGCIAVETMWVRVTKLTTVTVSKVVTGNMGDKNKDFLFTATLTNENGNNIDFSMDSTDDVTIAGNTASFTLKDGESLDLTDIPVGSIITVIETDNTEYTVSYTVDGEVRENAGNIEVSDGTTIVFTNTKNVLVDSGIFLDNLPYIVMLVVVGLGTLIVITRKRKYKTK